MRRSITLQFRGTARVEPRWNMVRIQDSFHKQKSVEALAAPDRTVMP